MLVLGIASVFPIYKIHSFKIYFLYCFRNSSRRSYGRLIPFSSENTENPVIFSHTTKATPVHSYPGHGT